MRLLTNASNEFSESKNKGFEEMGNPSIILMISGDLGEGSVHLEFNLGGEWESFPETTYSSLTAQIVEIPPFTDFRVRAEGATSVNVDVF